MKKVILVDGNNLLFRSYYATSSYTGNIMKNSSGFPTNAIYSFINMINKILEEEKPEYILVAFDKGKTFRHTKYDFYKAGRLEMPEDLKLQFPKAKEILDAMGIFRYEIENFEADDIIGTLAKMVDEEDEFVATIVSSDKDLLQLITKEVDVKLLKKDDYIKMTEDKFYEVYQTEPIHMIDLKALMGDSSDNIPGVKGIGEKTAIKLISTYHTLDNLYNNIDEISGKTKEKLLDGKDSAYMSYEIATIYREVPLDFSLEDLKYKGINKERFATLLRELEFKSLIKKYDLFDIEIQEKAVNEHPKYQLADIKEFDPTKEFSYYLELDDINYYGANALGMGICDGHNIYYLNAEEIKNNLEIFNSNSPKYTYDVKKNIVFLKKNFNIKIENNSFDTMIAAYLLDYVVKDDISYLARAFKYQIPSYEETFGSDKRIKLLDEEQLKKIICDKTTFIYETRDKLLQGIKDYDELKLFEEIEMPLANVLADMELEGIKVNDKYLEELSTELNKKIDLLQKEIYEYAQESFNIMSPKQLGIILFEKLQIPYPKRMSSSKNYSTSKDVLDKVISYHPIVEKILDYRMVTKLYTNYAEGLKLEIKEDGKIHTVFNQTLTRTGRLSSVRPNLQNIPIRDDYGKLVRKAFVAEENSVLLSSDYSQVELRMFAHMSGVDALRQAFINDKDIHTETAAEIYNVKENEVTPNMRRTAKAVNFGILYGISSFGLSEDLKINVKEAKEFLEKYLNSYNGVKDYMDREKEKAYQDGYVTTIMNRRRVISELQSSNYMVRTQGERIALNTPIQGSSADILKKAMIDIYNEFNKRKLKSKMLIQVHDELIFNVLIEEKEEVEEIVRNLMENVYKLSVPLKVEISTGKTWYDAK